MALKRLTEAQFQSFCNFRYPQMPGFHQEEEWWASDNENVIGAVVLDLIDKDWSWVILGRDQAGQFRAFDTGVSLPSQEKARSRLFNALIAHAHTGIFPQ